MTQTSAYPARSSDAAAASSRTSVLLRFGLARLQPWSDWIVLIVTAAALYPMFGRSSDMGPFYSAATPCVLIPNALLSYLQQSKVQADLVVSSTTLASLRTCSQRLI